MEGSVSACSRACPHMPALDTGCYYYCLAVLPQVMRPGRAAAKLELVLAISSDFRLHLSQNSFLVHPVLHGTKHEVALPLQHHPFSP